MSVGINFGDYLVYGGNVQRDVGTSAEIGPTVTGPTPRAVRFRADPGNGNTIFYKGGPNASSIATGSGDQTVTGVPLAAGEWSDWLPGAPSDYYFIAGAITQNLHIEWMV